MRRARVDGEAHNSDSDLDEILSVDFSEYDAVFVEHYDNSKHRIGLNIGLILFMISFRIYNIFRYSTYHEYDEVKEKCRENGVCYEEGIDLDPIETYHELRLAWKLVIPTGVLIVSGLLSLIFFISLLTFAPASLYIVSFTSVIVFLALFIALENLIVEFCGAYAREKSMATQIFQRSTRNGYEDVLIICGDLHRPIIGHFLQNNGWDIEQNSTNSCWSLLYKPVVRLRLWILKNIGDSELPNPD